MNVIGIIGSQGRYGKWLTRFFEQRGDQVIGADIETAHSGRYVVENADVVIFATPIKETPALIEALVSVSRPDQLWLDIASLKSAIVSAMLQSNAEVVGLHPMCAPPATLTLNGETLVVCEARLGHWQLWFNELLQNLEGRVIRTSPEEHDRIMAGVQVLAQSLPLIMVRALDDLNISIETASDYATPLMRSLLLAAGRMLAQDAQLFTNILFGNPHSRGLLIALQEEAAQLAKLLATNSRSGYVDQFEAARAYYGGDRADIAYHQFENLFID
ncbi:MAG: prephenate dehydrogenase/arogenate dehydrogenase family protein [Candidatus Buchananbacteria bacterium]|nr:prephenate dehydrogenase/arogenate dehydrogenase family protein [Candidatus Buchananbacteria bacterium]